MNFLRVLSRKEPRSLYGRRIKVFSPAKINLYLNILGKYPNGYHRLESIVERISLCDEIVIETSSSGDIEITCEDKLLQNKNNLCVKAAMLIRERAGLDCGFKINLKKNIPVGSGLGGGSSNAAFTILAINKLLRLRLSREAIYDMGQILGSDVNFFLSQSGFAVMSGRGESIAPFKAKPMRHFIIWPKAGLSTKEVYQNTSAKLTKFLDNVNIIRYALKKGDTVLLKSNIFNALEASAVSLCPPLRRLKKYLGKNGVFCAVTGSGSAVYTIGSRLHPGVLREIKRAGYSVFTTTTL